VLINKRTLL